MYSNRSSVRRVIRIYLFYVPSLLVLLEVHLGFLSLFRTGDRISTILKYCQMYGLYARYLLNILIEIFLLTYLLI